MHAHRGVRERDEGLRGNPGHKHEWLEEFEDEWGDMDDWGEEIGCVGVCSRSKIYFPSSLNINANATHKSWKKKLDLCALSLSYSLFVAHSPSPHAHTHIYTPPLCLSLFVYLSQTHI